MKKKLGILFVLLLAFGLPFVALAGGYWTENFDSYATGADLHGVGGWKGWDNSPGATAYTSDTQARSAPNSVVISTTADLVHEYSGYTSGQWVYTVWTYVPDDMVGVNDFIMLNDYNDGGPYSWSVTVQFDVVNGVVLDWNGAFLPIITDQWVELRVEIDLDNNSQTVYYDDTELYTDTWTDHISSGGSLNIGAVDLFANGATSMYYDDMSLLPAGGLGLEVAKSPDSQTITVGGNADFTITVTNTGTITWTDVTAVDPLVAACDNTMSDLAPGDSASYSCTDTGVSSSYTNTIWVTGTITGGPTMTVSDTAVVTANQPTSVSLSGFSGESGSTTLLWVAALLVGALAMGGSVALVSRRQRLQQK